MAQLSYSDMIRFFQIFPKITYIYDHSMNSDLHGIFISKVKEIIKQKSLPTEDLCKIFDIIVKTTAFASPGHLSVVHEVLGRLRHSLHDIPKDLFPLTLCNLIEFQNPSLAQKAVTSIVMEMKDYPTQILKEFTTDVDRIYLFWSLMQVESCAKDLANSLEFLESVDVKLLKEDQLQKFT